MKKQFFAAFLGTLMIANSVAWADGMTVIKENNTVNVSLNAKPNTQTIMFVVEKGQSINDNQNILAVKESTADKNGIAEFSFNMPEYKNGASIDNQYDVYSTDNTAQPAGSFWYASTAHRNLVMTEIKNSQSGLKDIFEGTKQIIDENQEQLDNVTVLKALDFDVDAYQALSSEADKDKVFVLLSEIAGNILQASDENIIKGFNDSVYILNCINGNKDDIKSNLIKINPSFNGTEYIKNDDTLQNWIAEYIAANKGYTTADGFNKALETANALYIVNNTRFDAMSGTLDTYKSQLGLVGDAVYASYTSAKNQNSINEKLVALLKQSPAKTQAELKTAIQQAIADANNPGDGSGNGSGNGSGSGSGSGSGGGSNGGNSGSFISVANNAVGEKEYYNDLANAAWAKDAINYLTEKNILSGDGTGEFRPNDILKREEFVKIIVEATGSLNNTAECSFDDVLRDKWYYKYISSAVEKQIAYGKTDRIFGIGDELTREDMMVLCYRAAQGIKTIVPIREKTDFADESDISSYAKDAVAELYKAGIANGYDGNIFNPQKKATRAEGAMIIYKLFFNK